MLIGVYTCLPPFFKAYNPVVIRIDLLKELVKFPWRYEQTGLLKGCLELAFIEIAIMVAVYRIK